MQIGELTYDHRYRGARPNIKTRKHQSYTSLGNYKAGNYAIFDFEK